MNLNYTKHKGFSLIELMIAVLIGLIMLAALLKLFDNFSSMNRTQNGLARIQENGRYVTMRLKKDLEHVGYQPCATISLDSPQRIERGFAVRPYINFSTMTNGLPSTKVIDPQFMIQGHECNASGNCVPSTDSTSFGIDPSVNNLPAAGTSADSRAFQTDILTVRYLASSGVKIVDANINTLFLDQNPSLKPLSLVPGDSVLVANCFNSMILTSGTISNDKITIPSADIDENASVFWAKGQNNTRVFNFTDDFVTVTYYIGLKNHPTSGNQLISSLYRIENGGEPQEIIEGVERFDLTYGVQFSDGKVGYLSAKEIEEYNDTSKCITEPLIPSSFGIPKLTNQDGCLWRSIFAIKVNLLLNTIYTSSTSNSEIFTYSQDAINPQLPKDIPSGINPGRMYRKEFTETISLQSYNL
jgi:type IV pilus assembly protein PilW